MGEHQAIVHYLTHAWTVVRQYGDVIEAISRDEMRHFKWLSHTIVALGGVPDLTPPDLLPALNGLEALNYDIDAEDEAISQYLRHQRDIGEPRVRRLIGRIVVDERYHRQRFIDLRRQYQDARPGAETAGSAPVLNEAAERLQQMIAAEYQNILRFLMQSFLEHHLTHVGQDAEDRATDAMKHLSWIAEALSDAGKMPQFHVQSMPWAEQLQRYKELRGWADANLPDLVPLLDRIIHHDEYPAEPQLGNDWTVGSASQGGWN